MLGWVGGHSGMSPWRKVSWEVCFSSQGGEGKRLPGLGVAGWTPVTEFLWLLKLRKDCRGQEMSLETIMGYCNGLRKGWILVLSGRQSRQDLLFEGSRDLRSF